MYCDVAEFRKSSTSSFRDGKQLSWARLHFWHCKDCSNNFKKIYTVPIIFIQNFERKTMKFLFDLLQNIYKCFYYLMDLYKASSLNVCVHSCIVIYSANIGPNITHSIVQKVRLILKKDIFVWWFNYRKVWRSSISQVLLTK